MEYQEERSVIDKVYFASGGVAYMASYIPQGYAPFGQ